MAQAADNTIADTMLDKLKSNVICYNRKKTFRLLLKLVIK